MKTTCCWNGDTYEVELCDVTSSTAGDRVRSGAVGDTGVRIELRTHADVVRSFWTATVIMRSRVSPLSGVVEIRSSAGEYRQHALDELLAIVRKLDHLEIVRCGHG